MKNSTQRVIEFLSHPEVTFGGEEDLLVLEDPAVFQARVAGLLDEYPQIFGASETDNLKGQLDGVAWSFVGLEFQARIEQAARFFDDDMRGVE
jgi:hypothetical protein